MNSKIELVSVFGAAYVADAGTTLTVANAPLPGAYFVGSGSGIDNGITNSADINSPTWVPVISLTNFKGRGRIAHTIQIPAVGLNFPLCAEVHSAETSGRALRIQIVRDGVIDWDLKIVGNNTTIFYNALGGVDLVTLTSVQTIIKWETSLLIQFARQGAFTNAGSVIGCGQFIYEKLE